MAQQIKFEPGCLLHQLSYLVLYFGEWDDHRHQYKIGWDYFRYPGNYHVCPYIIHLIHSKIISVCIGYRIVFGRGTRPVGPAFSICDLVQVAAINTAMAALTKTVGVFPKERAIVDRERAKGSYLLGPYLLSKLVAEIPIGALFPLLFGSVLYPMTRLHPTMSR